MNSDLKQQDNSVYRYVFSARYSNYPANRNLAEGGNPIAITPHLRTRAFILFYFIFFHFHFFHFFLMNIPKGVVKIGGDVRAVEE